MGFLELRAHFVAYTVGLFASVMIDSAILEDVELAGELLLGLAHISGGQTAVDPAQKFVAEEFVEPRGGFLPGLSWACFRSWLAVYAILIFLII